MQPTGLVQSGKTPITGNDDDFRAGGRNGPRQDIHNNALAWANQIALTPRSAVHHDQPLVDEVATPPQAQTHFLGQGLVEAQRGMIRRKRVSSHAWAAKDAVGISQESSQWRCGRFHGGRGSR